jgi:hypothetical protein
MFLMSDKNSERNEKMCIVGLEFQKMTHWDRYILNENLAHIENQICPERPKTDDGSQVEDTGTLWRGNRRRHYRIDTDHMDLDADLDFRPARVKNYKAHLMDISASGCRLKLPAGEFLEIRQRIPNLRISFQENVLICRAVVMHVQLVDVQNL